jgi:hypothetical protein
MAIFTNIVTLADLRELLGHLVTYARCEKESRSASAARRLTFDEARSIASNIARLPDLPGTCEKDRLARGRKPRRKGSSRHDPH